MPDNQYNNEEIFENDGDETDDNMDTGDVKYPDIRIGRRPHSSLDSNPYIYEKYNILIPQIECPQAPFHIIDNPVSPSEYAERYSDTSIPIIIDLGSSEIRAGFATDPVPRLVIPNLIIATRAAVHHIHGIRDGAVPAVNKLDVSIYGNDLVGRYLSSLDSARVKGRSPHDGNIIAAPFMLPPLFNYIFSNLGLSHVSAVPHPVVLLECPLNPAYSRAAVGEVLYRLYGVSQLTFATDILCANVDAALTQTLSPSQEPNLKEKMEQQAREYTDAVNPISETMNKINSRRLDLMVSSTTQLDEGDSEKMDDNEHDSEVDEENLIVNLDNDSPTLAAIAELPAQTQKLPLNTRFSLVVSISHKFTHVMPIVNGIPVYALTKRIPIGVFSMLNHLSSVVNLRQPSLKHMLPSRLFALFQQTCLFAPTRAQYLSEIDYAKAYVGSSGGSEGVAYGNEWDLIGHAGDKWAKIIPPWGHFDVAHLYNEEGYVISPSDVSLAESQPSTTNTDNSDANPSVNNEVPHSVYPDPHVRLSLLTSIAHRVETVKNRLTTVNPRSHSNILTLSTAHALTLEQTTPLVGLVYGVVPTLAAKVISEEEMRYKEARKIEMADRFKEMSERKRQEKLHEVVLDMKMYDDIITQFKIDVDKPKKDRSSVAVVVASVEEDEDLAEEFHTVIVEMGFDSKKEFIKAYRDLHRRHKQMITSAEKGEKKEGEDEVPEEESKIKTQENDNVDSRSHTEELLQLRQAAELSEIDFSARFPLLLVDDGFLDSNGLSRKKKQLHALKQLVTRNKNKKKHHKSQVAVDASLHYTDVPLVNEDGEWEGLGLHEVDVGVEVGTAEWVTVVEREVACLERIQRERRVRASNLHSILRLPDTVDPIETSVAIVEHHDQQLAQSQTGPSSLVASNHEHTVTESRKKRKTVDALDLDHVMLNMFPSTISTSSSSTAATSTITNLDVASVNGNSANNSAHISPSPVTSVLNQLDIDGITSTNVNVADINQSIVASNTTTTTTTTKTKKSTPNSIPSPHSASAYPDSEASVIQWNTILMTVNNEPVNTYSPFIRLPTADCPPADQPPSVDAQVTHAIQQNMVHSESLPDLSVWEQYRLDCLRHMLNTHLNNIYPSHSYYNQYNSQYSQGLGLSHPSHPSHLSHCTHEHRTERRIISEQPHRTIPLSQYDVDEYNHLSRVGIPLYTDRVNLTETLFQPWCIGVYKAGLHTALRQAIISLSQLPTSFSDPTATKHTIPSVPGLSWTESAASECMKNIVVCGGGSGIRNVALRVFNELKTYCHSDHVDSMQVKTARHPTLTAWTGAALFFKFQHEKNPENMMQTYFTPKEDWLEADNMGRFKTHVLMNPIYPVRINK